MYVDLCSPNKTVTREMLNDMGANFIDLIKCMKEKEKGKEVFSEVAIKKGCHHERSDSSVNGECGRCVLRLEVQGQGSCVRVCSAE